MRRDLESSPPLAAPTLVENGGLPQPAIALAVRAESMPNSWVTLTLVRLLEFRAVDNRGAQSFTPGGAGRAYRKGSLRWRFNLRGLIRRCVQRRCWRAHAKHVAELEASWRTGVLSPDGDRQGLKWR